MVLTDLFQAVESLFLYVYSYLTYHFGILLFVDVDEAIHLDLLSTILITQLNYSRADC